MTLRWDPYALGVGVESATTMLRAAHVDGQERPVVLAMGTGFDPRCLQFLSLALEALGPAAVVVAHIELPGATESADAAIVTMAEDHVAAFNAATTELDVRHLAYPDVHDPMTAGPRIGDALLDVAGSVGAGVVLVDVSSLPATIYFPAIRSLLDAVDAQTLDLQLLAGAAENPGIDSQIRGQGVSDARLIGGFRSVVAHADPFAVNPTLWVPVVGEGAAEELEKIHNRLAPKETLPVLPSPSRDPRRGDAIMLELWPTLVDRFRASPDRVVLADERNPFDVYRTICGITETYRSTLTEPLGELNIITSAHSSKLLSLGVLLAAYERGLGVAAAPRLDYTTDNPDDIRARADTSTPVLMWLTGSPYEP